MAIEPQPKITVPRQGVQGKQKYVEIYMGKEYPEAKGQIVKREGERRYIEVTRIERHKCAGDIVETTYTKKVYVDAKDIQLVKVEQEKPKKQTASRGGARKKIETGKATVKRPPKTIGTYKYDSNIYVYRDEKGPFIYKNTKGSIYHGDVLDGTIRVYIKESEVIKF